MTDKFTKTTLANGLTQIISYYPDGKKIQNKYAVNKTGNIEGEFVSYHGNGQLECHCTYHNGKLNGLCEFFNEAGKLEMRYTSIENVLVGVCEIYDKKGNLLYKEMYKDGKVVENKLNPERKSVCKILDTINELQKPTRDRKKLKEYFAKKYREMKRQK